MSKKFNICKVKTDRLRALPYDDLYRARAKLEFSYWDENLRDHGYYLLSSYLHELSLASPGQHKKLPLPKRQFAKRHAIELERRIWDAQAEAKCKLPDYEIVARDADYEDNPKLAAEIRKQARSHTTPYKKRLPKIR